MVIRSTLYENRISSKFVYEVDKPIPLVASYHYILFADSYELDGKIELSEKELDEAEKILNTIPNSILKEIRLNNNYLNEFERQKKKVAKLREHISERSL